jgi:hypothetical protein
MGNKFTKLVRKIPLIALIAKCLSLVGYLNAYFMYVCCCLYILFQVFFQSFFFYRAFLTLNLHPSSYPSESELDTVSFPLNFSPPPITPAYIPYYIRVCLLHVYTNHNSANFVLKGWTIS